MIPGRVASISKSTDLEISADWNPPLRGKGFTLLRDVPILRLSQGQVTACGHPVAMNVLQAGRSNVATRLDGEGGDKR